MITVFGGKPHFGLPNPSPFVCKTYIDLKRAGLSYAIAEASFRKAPKGKIPYLQDDGEMIADSEFIRAHVTRKYGYDFDQGHDADGLAKAWAVARMMEDRFYWFIVYERWALDENFNKGPAKYFDVVPSPVRPLIRGMIKRQIRKALWGQGTSRHSWPEIKEMARLDLRALDLLLGGRDWLLGETPCGADSSVLAMLMTVYCPFFDEGLRPVGLEFPRLAAYEARGRQLYFPEFS